MLLYNTILFMYISAKIPLEADHVHQLHSGGKISMYGRNVGQGDMVHLTKTQMRRLEKSHASGRPIQLRMSPAQLKYNAKHGAGVIRDIWNGIKTGAKFAYKHGKPIAKAAAKFALPHIENALDAQLGAIENPAARAAVSAVSKAGFKAIKGKLGGKTRKDYNLDVYNHNSGQDYNLDVYSHNAKKPLYNISTYATGPNKAGNGRKRKGAGFNPLGELGRVLGVPSLGDGRKTACTTKGKGLLDLIGLGKKKAAPKKGKGLLDLIGLGKKKKAPAKKGKGLLDLIGLGRKKKGSGFLDRLKESPGNFVNFAKNPGRALVDHNTPIPMITKYIPYGDQLTDVGVALGSKLIPGSGRKKRGGSFKTIGGSFAKI